MLMGVGLLLIRQEWECLLDGANHYLQFLQQQMSCQREGIDNRIFRTLQLRNFFQDNSAILIGPPQHSPYTGFHAGANNDLREREQKELEGKKQKWRATSRSMSSSVRSAQPNPTTQSEPAMSWMKWIDLLQARLRDCPADTMTRATFALLLEEFGKPDEALCHWNAVLVCDPNSLKAREGVARCRQRIG